jgi:hypothetical protein
VAVGVAVRLLVFTGAVYLAARLRQGRNWARVALAVLLGGIGTLSLAIGPVTWLADRHSAVLDQLVLADLIVSGAFDRHVRRCRLRYRRRRDRLGAALAEHAPTVKAVGVAAGLHAVLLLPEPGPSEQDVVAGLAARSVAVDGLAGTGGRPAHTPPAWSSATRPRPSTSSPARWTPSPPP